MELWYHIDFSRWRPYSRKCTFGFRFFDGIRLKRWKSICIPNFDEISQSTAEIKPLPVSENGRPPYWNSVLPVLILTYVYCVVIGISFCICLPNFIASERSAAELWRHIDFSSWRPYSRKCTSGWTFSDGVCLRSWQSICVPNFDEISRSTAEIKLLPVSENGIWNFTYSYSIPLSIYA